MKTDVQTLTLGKYFLASLILALLILEMTFLVLKVPKKNKSNFFKINLKNGHRKDKIATPTVFLFLNPFKTNLG